MNSETKPPAPAEIDELAKEHCELEEQIAGIRLEAEKEIKPLKDRLAPIADRLKAWSESFGGAHATKSRLLTGLAFEVMTTVSSSTSLDQAGAGVFLEACKKAGQTRIFNKLFETLTVYRTLPTADQVARAELPARLAVAFMRCFITKSNAPRMEVRPRKVSAGATA